MREVLSILTGLLVHKSAPDLAEFHRNYHTDRVLARLRDIAKEPLWFLPSIVGFGPCHGGRYCQRPCSVTG